MLLEQPWARVKDPVAIPTPTTAPTLEALSDHDLAALLRDHLVPRQPHGVERTRWESLWRVLTADDDLAERTSDVLEQFLANVETALNTEGADEHSRKRMEKFRRFCDDAWQRLQLDYDRPLGWAGRAGTGFNPAGRAVINKLVNAIDRHRNVAQREGEAREADRQLWKVLSDIGLDPAQHDRQTER